MLCLFLLACQPRQELKGQRYDLKGQVVSVDKANRRVTISHEEIKGYMDAMTMPFPLKDDWPLDVLAPGDQISATLVVGQNSFWLEDVVVTKQSASQAANENKEDATEPRAGDPVPDYSLVNQDGKRIHLEQYRGKALLLTFIYTRCPLPEYCTLMSNNFAEIEKELQKTPELYNRTRLLSISIDTKYDTPKVLRSYGASHTGNYDKETFAHWEFASGQPEEIKGIAQFFGLSYSEEADQIVHSLRTAIIAPDGKVFKIYRGNDWKPAEVLQDLHRLLEEKR